MKQKYSNVKTYSHETLPGALAALKGDLGDDAFIIHTRQIEKKNFLGIKGKPIFEIQACASGDTQVGAKSRTNPAINKAYRLSEPSSSPMNTQSQQMPRRQDASTPWRQKEFEKISGDIELVKTMLKEVVLKSRENDDLAGLNDEIQNLYNYLVNQGVREIRARTLVKELNQDLKGEDLHNPRKLKEELRRRLVDRIQTAPPLEPGVDQPRVAAFIGPTGVGKTTTISKLAGYYHHFEHLDVALLTIDTYRIAAAEQLHRVAEIVDVPIRSETSPLSLKRGIEEFAKKDLIMIDTAGRSQRDTLQMNELKKFLEASSPDDVFLVLPVNQDIHCLEQVLEQFGPMATKLVLSKIDETTRLGPLIDLLLNTDLPVVYWTFGQSIPDDIAAVNSERLAKLLLGEESL